MDNQHFNKLFWFCCAVIGIGLAFLIMLCFIPVPKSSERFADNCQGFFQGSIVTAAMAYLLGGNLPSGKKNSQATDQMNVDAENVNVETK